MLRELGPPTFFLTLSSAEYESPDIDSYLRKINDVSDSYPTGKLCNEDPLTVSRKFSQKFHDFFNTVLLKGAALGVATLLQEGVPVSCAPHYHRLLWIKDAPVAGRDDDDVVLKFIPDRISCRIPEEDSNPELHRLVTQAKLANPGLVSFLFIPSLYSLDFSFTCIYIYLHQVNEKSFD